MWHMAHMQLGLDYGLELMRDDKFWAKLSFQIRCYHWVFFAQEKNDNCQLTLMIGYFFNIL